MKLAVLLFLATVGAFLTFGAFFMQPFQHKKLKIIVYETDQHSTSLEMFLSATDRLGLETTVVGKGSSFKGFGSKYVQLKDALIELEGEPETLIAVIDGRDVLLNVGFHVDQQEFEERLDHFVTNFEELTEDKPDAILISAEQQCCVAALCHSDSPAFYFDPISGTRNNRACSSGEENCPWQDNENVKNWQSMMELEAWERTESRDASPYLNAGMMVGTAENLVNLIEMMDLGEEEDDQAVLSAMYLQSPDLIVLDYNQEILGNNAWPKGLEHGCIYDFDSDTEDDAFLTNVQTRTVPLIIHTPGKFYECLDTLIERLGGVSDERHKDSSLEFKRQLQYGNYQYGNYQYGSYYGNYGSTPGTAAPSPSPSKLVATTAAPTEPTVTLGTPETAAPTEAPQARSGCFWSFIGWCSNP